MHIFTNLQTFVALKLTQVFLQEQQVDAEVIITASGRLQIQHVTESRQQVVWTEELSTLVLTSRLEGSVNHSRYYH